MFSIIEQQKHFPVIMRKEDSYEVYHIWMF